MARLLKHLLCKHEEMSVHIIHIKRPGTGLCACDPSTEEVETGRSPGLPGQPALFYQQAQTSERSCLRIQRMSWLLRDDAEVSLWTSHTLRYSCTLACIHRYTKLLRLNLKEASQPAWVPLLAQKLHIAHGRARVPSFPGAVTKQCDLCPQS